MSLLDPLYFASIYHLFLISVFFFFHDTATTELYTLSLHDALPICSMGGCRWPDSAIRSRHQSHHGVRLIAPRPLLSPIDRKSTRLNSSHGYISYAVFCLKKKKQHISLGNGRNTYACSLVAYYL